jgi:hypothetical protein
VTNVKETIKIEFKKKVAGIWPRLLSSVNKVIELELMLRFFVNLLTSIYF